MEDQEDTESSSLEPEGLNIGKLNVGDSPSPIDLAASRAIKLNDASKNTFDYGEPLLKGHIRLLQLHPGSGNDPIICSLLLSPLGSGRTSFEAVSYVWGSEDNPNPITCNWAIPFMNDKAIQIACPAEVMNNKTVTDNLYRLLLRIRYAKRSRTLWIDQICIDQDRNPEKLKEKMRQVRMMAEVYSAADDILIWLGEEDSETATAFGVMKWMYIMKDASEQQSGLLLDYLMTTDDFSNHNEDVFGDRKTMKYLKSLLVHVQPAVLKSKEDPGREFESLVSSLTDHLMTRENLENFSTDVDDLITQKQTMESHLKAILSTVKEDPTCSDAKYKYFYLGGSDALNALLEKPWFTRSWIFQEAVSASSATVMCGSQGTMGYALPSM